MTPNQDLPKPDRFKSEGKKDTASLISLVRGTSQKTNVAAGPVPMHLNT